MQGVLGAAPGLFQSFFGLASFPHLTEKQPHVFAFAFPLNAGESCPLKFPCLVALWVFSVPEHERTHFKLKLCCCCTTAKLPLGEKVAQFSVLLQSFLFKEAFYLNKQTAPNNLHHLSDTKVSFGAEGGDVWMELPNMGFFFEPGRGI